MSTSHVGRLHDAGLRGASTSIQCSENSGQIALEPRNWRLLKRRTCVACGCQPFMTLPQPRISTHQTPSHHPLSCDLTIQVTIAAPFRSRPWPSLQILPFRCFALFCRSIFQAANLRLALHIELLHPQSLHLVRHELCRVSRSGVPQLKSTEPAVCAQLSIAPPPVR
jgi:hypothetical protein